MTLKKISVQWRPGSEKNPLFQLKDDVGNETLIGAEEVARLMSEVGQEGKSEVLFNYFEKEIERHRKTL